MTYKVRTAMADDAEAFSPLLALLGYPGDPSSLRTRIHVILNNPDAVLLVATSESSDKAIGLLSMHFIPQLGLEGDVARLGFLVVDENCHTSGIGKLLESHAEKLARERGCDRMVLNLTIWR
jgi:GNAT superfamily N-acetyltransferase